MNEKYVPKQAGRDGKDYSAYLATEYEVMKILGEIDTVFSTTKGREEAERVIIEKLAPKMDEALKKSRQAFDSWFDRLRASE